MLLWVAPYSHDNVQYKQTELFPTITTDNVISPEKVLCFLLSEPSRYVSYRN